MTSLNWLRTMLLATASAALCALAVGCGAGHEPDQESRDDIEFGIWVPVADADARFVATKDVPYVADQAFGWRVRGEAPAQPIRWVEVLKLPRSPQSWAGVEASPNVRISGDGTTVTTHGESGPGDSFIGNLWFISIGDPMGQYDMTVEFEDGTRAKVRFELVLPKEGPNASSPSTSI